MKDFFFAVSWWNGATDPQNIEDGEDTLTIQAYTMRGALGKLKSSLFRNQRIIGVKNRPESTVTHKL